MGTWLPWVVGGIGFAIPMIAGLAFGKGVGAGTMLASLAAGAVSLLGTQAYLGTGLFTRPGQNAAPPTATATVIRPLNEFPELRNIIIEPGTGSSENISKLKALLNQHPEWANESYGFDPPLLCAAGNTEVVEVLLERNPRLALIRDKQGDTPLHSAARGPMADQMFLLLVFGDEEKGIKGHPELLTAQDKDGETPLHLVAKLSDKSTLVEGHWTQIVPHLFQAAPALATMQDHQGKTILHYAVASGEDTFVRPLILAGPAMLQIKDQSGKRPIDIAREAGNPLIIKILQEAEKQPAAPAKSDQGTNLSDKMLRAIDQAKSNYMPTSTVDSSTRRGTSPVSKMGPRNSPGIC